MTRRTRRVSELVSPPDSASTSSSSFVPPLSSVSPSPASFYESLYRWAPTDLLGETSTFTTLKGISTYRKRQSCHRSRIFGLYGWWLAVWGNQCVLTKPPTPRAPFVSFIRPFFEGWGSGCLSPPFERPLLTELNVAPA